MDASGWEKSTVTSVSKDASTVPGVGETDVIRSGAGGAVVVVDGEPLYGPGLRDRCQGLE